MTERLYEGKPDREPLQRPFTQVSGNTAAPRGADYLAEFHFLLDITFRIEHRRRCGVRLSCGVGTPQMTRTPQTLRCSNIIRCYIKYFQHRKLFHHSRPARYNFYSAHLSLSVSHFLFCPPFLVLREHNRMFYYYNSFVSALLPGALRCPYWQFCSRSECQGLFARYPLSSGRCGRGAPPRSRRPSCRCGCQRRPRLSSRPPPAPARCGAGLSGPGRSSCSSRG